MSSTPYIAIGVFALLWGSIMYQMYDDQKRFGFSKRRYSMRDFAPAIAIGEPHDDPSLWFDDEPIKPTIDISEFKPDNTHMITFFKEQMSYNQDNQHTFDLKGSIHANLADICGRAIGLARDPYFQLNGETEIQSKVRQTDGFLETFLETESDDELGRSYDAIMGRLTEMGLIDAGI